MRGTWDVCETVWWWMLSDKWWPGLHAVSASVSAANVSAANIDVVNASRRRTPCYRQILPPGEWGFVQELELGVNRTSFLKFCFIYLPEIGRNVILGVGDLKFWRIISHGGFDCIGLLCTNTSIQTHAQWHRQVFDYVKVKVNIKVRICIALHCELTSEALRYGSHSCYTAKHTIPAFTT